MRKQQWRLGHAPCPLPSPLPHPPPPPRPPATTPQPMGEQQAPHLTRAMADERWRTVSWRMNKNLCLRRPVSEPGPLRMRDCRADHWTTETSCAWRRDMAPGSYVSQVQIISLQSIPVSQLFIGAQVTEHYRSAI
ncbi:hypothetical protein J6590_061522 [Homalodisca vitripennis]|nr:hypothetical protein J6590_103787 [Homalodisca vitripennis]KAG8296232.1 hypothetical protein J6590_061522 [Homalodisca vitripennis]